eukprot:1148544-Pelagomonas_calceolata.AAC.8
MSHCLRRLDELTLEQRERVLAHLLERLHMQAAATTAGQIAPNNTSGKIGMAQEESNLYAAIMISLRATPLCWQAASSSPGVVLPPIPKYARRNNATTIPISQQLVPGPGLSHANNHLATYPNSANYPYAYSQHAPASSQAGTSVTAAAPPPASQSSPHLQQPLTAATETGGPASSSQVRRGLGCLMSCHVHCVINCLESLPVDSLSIDAAGTDKARKDAALVASDYPCGKVCDSEKQLFFREFSGVSGNEGPQAPEGRQQLGMGSFLKHPPRSISSRRQRPVNSSNTESATRGCQVHLVDKRHHRCVEVHESTPVAARCHATHDFRTAPALYHKTAHAAAPNQQKHRARSWVINSQHFPKCLLVLHAAAKLGASCLKMPAQKPLPAQRVGALFFKH